MAIPIFAGEFLLSVLVQLCGEDQESAGAIELWHGDDENSYDLDLEDGCYGKLERFEFISRQTSFRKGFGLPGLAWSSGMPVFMKDLGNSQAFIRTQAAAEAGISSGVALPLTLKGDVFIAAFLSSEETPIAKQIEIWVPDESRQPLKFSSGYSVNGTDLKAKYEGTSVDKGDGPIGSTYLRGVPQVSRDLSPADVVWDSAGGCELECVVAFPVLERGWLIYIVARYL